MNIRFCSSIIVGRRGSRSLVSSSSSSNSSMRMKNGSLAMAAILGSGFCMNHSNSFSIVQRPPAFVKSAAAAAAAAAVHPQQHLGLRLFSKTIVGDEERNNNNNNNSNKRIDALDICQAGLNAVDPYRAVKNHWKVAKSGVLQLGRNDNNDESSWYKKEDYDCVVIVAFGKASSAMALSVAEVVREGFGKDMKMVGHVIVKDDHGSEEEWERLPKEFGVTLEEASHPIPNSDQAAQKVWDVCQEHAHERTLVVCGISGGGSALFCLPRPGITLQDLQQTNERLLQSGMSITDMNTIRIHLERGKGGKFAAHAVYPSTMATLVLSDIIGDPLHFIASGPTVPSPPSTQSISTLLHQYQLHADQTHALPTSVLNLLLPSSHDHDKQQHDDEDESITTTESSLQHHPMFSSSSNNNNNKKKYKQCQTILVGNNPMAVQAAAQYASSTLGYSTIVLGTALEGEAKHVAKVYTRMALHILSSHQKFNGTDPFAMTNQLPLCLIAGGETTVTLNHPSNDNNNNDSIMGKGGRNQELALQAAIDLYEQSQSQSSSSLVLPQITLASIGTDGTDGPTDAAGAIIDASTIINQQSYEQAQIALQTHNAYPYLKQHSALIQTGPTGTNVADLCVILIHPSTDNNIDQEEV